jgi:phytoene dehydrogenase-like protein
MADKLPIIPIPTSTDLDESGAGRSKQGARPGNRRTVRVAVAGGGIAGMTSALRLAQRGYAVTLYEEKPWLGGNLSSQLDPKTGLYHDVYPHMFSNFYVNFWDIAENELGLKRTPGKDTDFEARDSFWFLSRAGGYTKLKAAANPLELLRDMFAGVEQVSPLDMYLYLYSVLDLMAHNFDERGVLGLSLNGFVRSRPCVTEPVAVLHDATVMFVWSVHSAATSAASYQNFNRHTFGNVQPLLWLLRGSLRQRLIDPLEARLVKLGCRIVKNASLQGITVTDGRVTALDLRAACYDETQHKVQVGTESVQADPFDHVVLAVPPKALGHLADAGLPDRRLSRSMPRLAHAGKRLPSEPIAVMDLYFKRQLPGIPKENVAVTDSDCYFSFIDISQLWPGPEMKNVTALTLASSDYWALPSDDDTENAFHLVLELQRYLGNFKPGARWGDPDSDIDWERSRFRSNKDDVIFVNQVGSWAYRPKTHHPQVSNLFFAGDFCRNQVDMASVEAAVTSGINAAVALQASDPLGEPIALKTPPLVPDAALCALKLLLAPSAYAAKAWVTVVDAANKASGLKPAETLAHDLTTLARLPSEFAADVVDTVGTMTGDLLRMGAGALARSERTGALARKG